MMADEAAAKYDSTEACIHDSQENQRGEPFLLKPDPDQKSAGIEENHHDGSRSLRDEAISDLSEVHPIHIDVHEKTNHNLHEHGAGEALHAMHSDVVVPVNSSTHDDLQSHEIANSSDDEMMFNSPTKHDMDDNIEDDMSSPKSSRDEDILKHSPPRVLQAPSHEEAQHQRQHHQPKSQKPPY